MSEQSDSTASAAATQTILHIWPPEDSLLSFDPASVAALFYLQLAIPGQFSVAYSANPDLSPSGQLPFLTHGLHSTSTFPAIVKYVSNIAGVHDVDQSLDVMEKAQFSARIAHVQSDYGDLVAHMLYSLHANWWKVTRPALVSMLPVPQRYYVPGRIRESYKPRLEAADLWDVPGIEQEEEEDRSSLFGKDRKEKKRTQAEKFKQVFEREKVLAKARAFFSIYAKLLGQRRFFHPRDDRPTSLDIVVAAHTHILMNLPFVDTLLQSLLSESFPALVVHATTVQSFVFPNPQSFPPTVRSNTGPSLYSLLPWPVSLSWRRQKSERSGEDKQFARLRWGWIALAMAGVAMYWQIYGLGPGITLAIELDDTDEDISEDDDEGGLEEDDDVEEEVHEEE